MWAWGAIDTHQSDYAPRLGFADAEGLREEMARIHMTYEGAADTESNKAKGRVGALAQATGRDVPTLMRLVGGTEAARGTGELAATVQDLRDAVSAWRTMRGDV